MVSRIGVVTAAAVLALAAAAPAWAHTGEGEATRDYRSEVVGVEGAQGAVRAWVDGGDAFLVLQVRPGVEVIVPGYDSDEQFLRFDPSGTVFANAAGPSWYQNQDRYGTSVVPPTVSVDAEPQWVPVSSNGIYEWHDHRIHWMSPSPPRQVDRGARSDQHVFDWQVPLLVEGEPATISGRLFWRARPSPVPPVLAALGAALALAALAWLRRLPSRALAVGGAVALASGLALLPMALRPALPGEPSPLLVGVAAGLLGGAGLGALAGAVANRVRV